MTAAGPERWPVPPTFRENNIGAPDRLAWADRAPALVAEAAARWHVEPDGPPMTGWMGVVWPVREASGRAAVLKLGSFPEFNANEAVALTAWRDSHASVELLAGDRDTGALLLRRLDGHRSLEDEPGAEAATTVIARLLAAQSRAAPPGLPSLATEASHMLLAVDEHVATKPHAVSARDVERAKETLQTLVDGADGGPCTLLHGDAHFLNVLHTLPGEEPRWHLIDPLGWWGPQELEPVASLRNRWADALATGDPARALLRRLDIFVEHLSLDRRLALDLAHAWAVTDLVRLLPEQPGHMFVAPYAVMAGWATVE